MDDNDDSDSDVEISRKRKLNILEDEDSDETDDEDEESESDDETDDSEDNPGDDITLTDDVTNDQCAICLMEFTDQKVGVPNNCTHVFCLVCIQEWAKNINTCPVDRKVFYTIAVKKAENGVTIEEIKVEDKTQVKEEYEDPTSCEICGIGDREDRMLLCDGCDRGFHLECLSPPLDSVPDEEWFCRDCFIDTAQDNTQEHDTIDYSQHAIAFSDDEIPTFESEPRPIASSIISSRASTSQRRARTVATSRQRRRRRRTTQGSSRTPARRSKRKKTTKKTKSSYKGASTMTTHTSKPKRRKRKRRRKSAKKKKRKIKSDENVHQSTTRYLLPREMEPTATFSLFGSDFDLEYLPVIETPASAITSQQSSPPRSSTTANPDVLGSIFTGLNTLHSDSLSVDNKGRLRNEENKTASQSLTKPKVPRTSTQITSTSSHKEKKPDLLSGNAFTCCPRKMFGRCPIHGNVYKHVNDPSTEQCNEIETASRKLMNEKRLKRFDTTASACSFTRPAADCTSSAKNRNISPKFDPEKIAKLEHKEDKLTSSTFASSNSSLQTSQASLASYKIPRKTPTSTSNLTAAKSKSRVTFNFMSTNTKSKSPIKSPVKNSESRIARRKLKVPDVPKKGSGILHLLPPGVGRSPLKQTGVGDTNKQLTNKDPNSRSITHPTVPNTLNVSTANTSLKKIQVHSGYASKERLSKIANSKSTSSPNDPNEASTCRDFAPRYSSGHREHSSNLTADSIANVNDENSSHDLTPRSSSGQTTPFEHSRPVAVVRPTKIDENNSRGTSNDEEAAKRRKEGIERLQRREMICEEVRNALTPFYRHGEISKENYKYIYGRAVEKISKSSLPVVSRDVASLVRNYVKKLKGRQIHPAKSDI